MTDDRIVMQRRLDALPAFALPSGYSARWYRPGDEAIWRRIQERSDKLKKITETLFHEAFGDDERELARRMCFLLNAEHEAIGTATAWFDDDFHGQTYGRVHWVAIVPEQQGKGLAKPLMSIVCARLRELGHQRAYLTTSSLRPNAINLYRQFGFELT